MINELRIGKDSEGNSHGIIEVLSQNFPGGAAENHEKQGSSCSAEIRT
jgi:hypothetical protein